MFLGNVDDNYKTITIDWNNAIDKGKIYMAFRKGLGLKECGYSSDSLIESITQPEIEVTTPIVFKIYNWKNYFEINGTNDVIMRMIKTIINEQIYDMYSGKTFSCAFDFV